MDMNIKLGDEEAPDNASKIFILNSEHLISEPKTQTSGNLLPPRTEARSTSALGCLSIEFRFQFIKILSAIFRS